MKIAVSGKGGAGKTTLSAALTRLFEEEGRIVYAVDADPDASLGMALGFDEAELSGVRPLVELKEVIDQRVGGQGGMFVLNPKVDDVIEEFALHRGGIKLLRMGSIKKAASACYCAENSFLKAVMLALALDKDDVVIMDMCAGIEHLTRGTAQSVDRMLLVTEPTAISLKTAGVAAGLARDLGVPEVALVGNKSRGDEDVALIKERSGGVAVAGVLPYDPGVFGTSMLAAGREGPFWSSVRDIYRSLKDTKGQEG